MDRAKMMGQEKIGKLLIRFSVPAMIGMVVNASYNIVDRIYIGRGVGKLGIAGVTIGFPFVLVMMAIGMMIGLGTATLVSIRLGEKKKVLAEHIMANGTTMLLIFSSVITVVGLIFLDSMLDFLGASPEVMPYASEYMQIIFAGSIFFMVSFSMNNFIRAEGNPKVAMITMIIAAGLNIILDPIFIFALNMGIRGAAIATVLSQAVAAVWIVAYFYSGKSLLKLKKKNFRLKKTFVSKIAMIGGSAPGVMQFVASILVFILNKALLTHGGDIAVSAFGVVHSISMFIMMPIFGINQGSQPIIGFNYGAKNYARVKETLKLAAYGATILVSLGFIGTRSFPEQIIGLFAGDDEELIKVGVFALQYFLFALPIIGFQIVAANYFQAVGKPSKAMLLTLSRQVLFMIPCLLILPNYLGLKGVFISAPISDFSATVVTGILIYREMKNLGKDAPRELKLAPQFD